MGLFGFGRGDVRRGLAEVTPGVNWQIECFAGKPAIGVWFVALHKKDRALLPALSFEQAELLAADVWRSAAGIRQQSNSFSVWIESDDGRWAGFDDKGKPQESDSIPRCFT